jgi:hypothetical protein
MGQFPHYHYVDGNLQPVIGKFPFFWEFDHREHAKAMLQRTDVEIIGIVCDPKQFLEKHMISPLMEVPYVKEYSWNEVLHILVEKLEAEE